MCWSHQKLGVFPKTLFQLHGPIETAKMVISGWNPKKSGYNFFWIIPFITWGYWLPLEEAGCSLRLVTVWYWERERSGLKIHTGRDVWSYWFDHIKMSLHWQKEVSRIVSSKREPRGVGSCWDCIHAPPKPWRFWEINPWCLEISRDLKDWGSRDISKDVRLDIGFSDTSWVSVDYRHSLIINLIPRDGSRNPSLWAD